MEGLACRGERDGGGLATEGATEGTRGIGDRVTWQGYREGNAKNATAPLSKEEGASGRQNERSLSIGQHSKGMEAIVSVSFRAMERYEAMTILLQRGRSRAAWRSHGEAHTMGRRRARDGRARV